MELQHKPRLGILALMLEGYEPLFPGIMASQHKYVEEVIASLSGTADFVFPRIAASREAIEALTAQYNAEGLDGILILMLSYSQGQYLVHAMQRNTLPLALALVQPDETVGDDFEEWELTVNQGIHGSQDNANCLMRAGIPCAFFAGSRKNGELAAFAADFGAAAHTACALRRMKIGIIGKLAGMGDVIASWGRNSYTIPSAPCSAPAPESRRRISPRAWRTSTLFLRSTPSCRPNAMRSPCACIWVSSVIWRKTDMRGIPFTSRNSAQTDGSSIFPSWPPPA